MANTTERRFILRGVQDELEVYDDRVTLTPKGVMGFINKGMKGTKTIPMSSITAVQLKAAGLLTNGYIQFSLLGGNESTKGLFAAVSDENSFMFKKQENMAASEINEFIQSKMGMGRNVEPPRAASTMGDELGKLAALHQQGLLSDAEFASAKARVIGGSRG